MDAASKLFDRQGLRARRERAADEIDSVDFLFREVAERTADRLADFRRGFPLALEVGARHGVLAETLDGRGGIETLVQMELSPRLAARAAENGWPTVIGDEEYLPFAPGVFDLAIGVLGLHWTNDLPGALLQLGRSLKPDGLLLVSLLGGETLFELRQVLMDAELEIEGGVSPRVSPMVDVRDAGALLQRAGLALPVADHDRITVSYPNALKLMAELRAMGESNALTERRKTFTRRQTLLRAGELYQDRYADAEGRIPATFDVITLTAWSPHESQQKPLRPGSAAQRLADALDSEEQPAGDVANPDRER